MIVRGSKDSIGQTQPVSLLVLLWPRWLDGLIGHRWPSSLRVEASSDWCVCVCVCACAYGTLDSKQQLGDWQGQIMIQVYTGMPLREKLSQVEFEVKKLVILK